MSQAFRDRFISQGLEASARKLCLNNTASENLEQTGFEEYAEEQHRLKEESSKRHEHVTKQAKLDPRYVLTLKNFPYHAKFKHAPLYNSYSNWKYRGYYSDQFASDLQSRLQKKAETETGQQFFSMKNKDQEVQMPEKNMPLFPFDIEKEILDDFTVLLVGRRRSGKSFGARYIMYHLRHRFPFGIVITGTRLNNYWGKYIPDEYIHDIQDMNLVLDWVFARQTFLRAYPELGIDSRMFLILDDVMEDKFFIRYNSLLSKAFTNGRHFNIFVMVMTQDVKGIGPDLRENTDACIMFRIFEGERQKIADREWLSYLNNQEEFLWGNTGLMDKNTLEPFTETNQTTDDDRDENAVPMAVAILRARTTENLQLTLKKFVAEDPGPFEMGNGNYWKAGCGGDYKSVIRTFNMFQKPGKKIKVQTKGAM